VIPRRRLLLAGFVLLVAACAGRSGVDEPRPSALVASPGAVTLEPTAQENEPPAAEPESGAPPSAEPATVTQTDTEWGRIWDGVPSGFPVYPGSAESEEAGDEAVSATYSVGAGAPDEIATWLQQQLELATFSTEALSGPLEDGSFVIDSVGDASCRIETMVKPAGGLTLISVRYGADCPFD
jgi:hypothetical protein